MALGCVELISFLSTSTMSLISISVSITCLLCFLTNRSSRSLAARPLAVRVPRLGIATRCAFTSATLTSPPPPPLFARSYVYDVFLHLYYPLSCLVSCTSFVAAQFSAEKLSVWADVGEVKLNGSWNGPGRRSGLRVIASWVAFVIQYHALLCLSSSHVFLSSFTASARVHGSLPGSRTLLLHISRFVLFPYSSLLSFPLFSSPLVPS